MSVFRNRYHGNAMPQHSRPGRRSNFLEYWSDCVCKRFCDILPEVENGAGLWEERRSKDTSKAIQCCDPATSTY